MKGAPLDLHGKRVLVMGLGRFGGGLGVTQWLAAQGATILLTDLADAESLREPLESLSSLVETGAVELRLGEHRDIDFAQTDLIVANPAVARPWQNRFLHAARNAGRPITTELRFVAAALERRRTIGITGTAGKSTSSAMIAYGLAALGERVRFGGNIGGSLLQELDAIASDEWVVLELSSFMLHWLGAGVGWPEAPGWSPGFAGMTNIAPNHLDWHGCYEHYRRSKLNICRWQVAGDTVLRGENPPPRELAHPAFELRVPGAHNRTNALFAARLVSEATGASPARVLESLQSFGGLPHRLELVAEADGRRFFNDSKSTTPEATLIAVAAFDQPRRVHLIAGGYDKGSDLRPIADLAPRLGGFYTIGTTGPALAGRRRGAHVQTLTRAVETALSRMRARDVLLLSPGCASWDQYTNYEARGEEFRRVVRGALGIRD